MLDKKIFAKSILQLSKYYPKFELDLEQTETWYKFYQYYDEDSFLYIVKSFIQENSYAPQSPAHLRNSNHTKLVLPPKWMIKQIIGNDQKQLEHKSSVDTEELKQLMNSFKEEKDVQSSETT